MMKKNAVMMMSIAALLLTAGCGNTTKKQTEEVKTYQYTTEQVYTEMCAKCHGQNGEGVAELNEQGKPKGPALNKQELYELKLAITDIKSGGLNQSSGTEHEVMEHNYKAIKKKGMDYDTDSMATYIVEHFQQK